MAKTFLLVLVSALISQGALSQYAGRLGLRPGLDGLGYDALAYGGWNRLGCGGARDDIAAAGALAASHGGGLAVVTSSAAPTGLGVTSENVYEGTVSVCGSVPFLGTAEVVGEFPTVGAGAINYGCGDGAVGIIDEGVGVAPAIAPAVVAPAAVVPGVAATAGYRGVNRGCGCGNYAY